MKHVIITLFLSAVLLAQPGKQQQQMISQKISASGNTVTYDTSAKGDCTTTTCTVITIPITIGSNSNRQLPVIVSAGCSSTQTAPQVLTMTYATVGLSQAIHSTPSPPDPSRYSDMWTMPAGTQPTTGTNNLVVTFTGDITVICNANATILVQVFSLFNVDQTTIFTSTGSGNGSSGTASITLSSSAATDLVVHGGCGGSNVSAPTGTQRQLDNLSTLNSCGSGVAATATGGTTSVGFTISPSDSWLNVAGSFKAQ